MCEAPFGPFRQMGTVPFFPKTLRITMSNPSKSAGPPGRGWSTLAVHGGEERQKARILADRPDLPGRHLQLCRHAVADRLHRPEAAARGVRPLRQSDREDRRAEAGRLGRRRATPCSMRRGMTAIAGLALGQASRGRRDSCWSTSATCGPASSASQELSRFGITTRLVPAGDYDALEAAITPATRMLFSESPTNPHLSVIDLERFAAIGKRPRRARR